MSAKSNYTESSRANANHQGEQCSRKLPDKAETFAVGELW
jgi:hypothetical protein